MTQAQYEGVTITLNQSTTDIMDWLVDDEVDADATLARYTERLAEAMEAEFPGARVAIRLTETGGRPHIWNDPTYLIDEADIAPAYERAMDRIAPQGNPEDLVVLNA